MLNMMYPTGHALSVMIVMYGYLALKSKLAKQEKYIFLSVLLALALQFLTDYMFVISNQLEGYINGGSIDYMYVLTYFVMILAIGMVVQAHKKGFLTYGQDSLVEVAKGQSIEVMESLVGINIKRIQT
jgi:hypothetical protein